MNSLKIVFLQIIFLSCIPPVWAQEKLTLEARVAKLEAQVAELEKSLNNSVSEVGKEIVIEREMYEREVSNLLKVLGQARAVPYFREGQAVGLRLFAIKPGSLFEAIGLLNGDVLISVDGKPTVDPNHMVESIAALFPVKRAPGQISSIRIQRSREDLVLKYRVKE